MFCRVLGRGRGTLAPPNVRAIFFYMLPRSYTVFVCHSRTLDLDFLSQNTDSPIETKIEIQRQILPKREKDSSWGGWGAGKGYWYTTKFCTGGFAPRSNDLPFICHF